MKSDSLVHTIEKTIEELKKHTVFIANQMITIDFNAKQTPKEFIEALDNVIAHKKEMDLLAETIIEIVASLQE